MPIPSNGQPLPPSLQHKYEAEFGSKLSDVTIHESHVPTMMGAEAYTRGNEIHFQPGGANLHSEEGKKLLGHELAHVVQQQNGNVAGNKSVFESLEQEAEDIAERVTKWFG